MSRFEGSLRLPGEAGPGLSITLDLDAERISMFAGSQNIGGWSLAEIGIRGEDDGFHLIIDGEEIIISTEDDAGFALAVGLQSASPRMRRRIASALR